MKSVFRRMGKLTCLMPLFFLYLLCLPAGADEREAESTYSDKQFKAVIKEYKALIKKNPEDENAHLGLIQAYKAIGESKDVFKAVKQALERLPTSVPLHIASGDLYFQEANMDEAAKSYRKAVQLDAKNARGYFGLFKVNMFAFNRKTAWEMIMRAHELDPKDQEIAVTYNRHLPLASQLRLHEKYPGVWRMVNPPEKTEIQLKTVSGLPWPVRLLIREEGRIVINLNEMPTIANSISPSGISYSVDVTVTPDGRIEYGPADPLLQPVITRTVWDYGMGMGSHDRIITGMMTTLFTIEAVIATTDGPRKMTLGLTDAIDIKGIILKRKFAEDLKLDMIGDNSNWFMAKKMQIGPLEFEDCPVGIMVREPSLEIDGFVGLDMFERYLVTLDLPNSVLRLNPLPPINGQPFDDPDSWNNMDRSIPAELESFLPLGKLNRHVVIHGNLKKKIYGYFDLSADTNQFCVNRKKGKNLNSVNVGTFRTIINGPCQAPQLRQVQPDVFDVVERLGTLDFHVLRDYAITIDYRDGLFDIVKVYSYP